MTSRASSLAVLCLIFVVLVCGLVTTNTFAQVNTATESTLFELADHDIQKLECIPSESGPGQQGAIPPNLPSSKLFRPFPTFVLYGFPFKSLEKLVIEGIINALRVTQGLSSSTNHIQPHESFQKNTGPYSLTDLHRMRSNTAKEMDQKPVNIWFDQFRMRVGGCDGSSSAYHIAPSLVSPSLNVIVCPQLFGVYYNPTRATCCAAGHPYEKLCYPSLETLGLTILREVKFTWNSLLHMEGSSDRSFDPNPWDHIHTSEVPKFPAVRNNHWNIICDNKSSNPNFTSREVTEMLPQLNTNFVAHLTPSEDAVIEEVADKS